MDRTIKANKDNDLKYRSGLPELDKEQSEEELQESTSDQNGKTEYFTE